MRPLLNVLYVTTEDSYLARQGETICVHIGGEEKVRIPAHTLESIVCFGHTTVSTPLIGFCSERGIRLSFLSEHGRFYGRLEGSVSGNVLLRRAQYRAASTGEEAEKIAWSVVLAKVLNSRNVLLRAAREAPGEGDGERLRAAAEEMRLIAQQLEPSVGTDVLRGLEGAAAQMYFSAFDGMIRANRENFRFVARMRRPPPDRINALLSFLYTMLVHDTSAALEAVGLDPQMGFLHSVRPGRPSLALDLAEELRAPVCDRLALSLGACVGNWTCIVYIHVAAGLL